jgi:hypothetical protein
MTLLNESIVFPVKITAGLAGVGNHKVSGTSSFGGI